MKKKSNHQETEYGGIHFPGHELPKNSRLFEVPGYRPATAQLHPPIDHTLEGLKKVLELPGEYRGLDLEFKRNLDPTIISITAPDFISSLPWSDEVARVLRPAFSQRGRYEWVAHSGIGADRPVVEHALPGVSIPLEEMDDSMVSHWLCHMELTKAPQKEESDDAGSLGFMGLWTMASLTTDLWMYKECRGSACDGPCPRHAPEDYCGIDSWAGLVGHLEHRKILEAHNLPHENYRQAMHLSDICYRMELQGIAVDKKFTEEANNNFDAIKESLFVDNQPFNPKSPKQVIEWFRANNVSLKTTEKDEVRKALEKVAKNAGFEMEELSEAPELPPILSALHRLYEFKSTGKGLDSWFAEKYFGKDGLLHPRFIVTGTSTSRLSSSRPNFMNIPKRGPMAIARQAIIPRSNDLEIALADVAQLELRCVLWYADIDQAIIGADAFNWLVAESGGAFEDATKLVQNKKARDLAKIASHGGDYLLGFKLIDPDELSTPRIKKEIECGALRVYTKKYMPHLKRDWTFMGKIVAFTGKKLAEMLYGDGTVESRRKAQMILEDVYFKKFFGIREWQMRVLDFVQDHGYVQSATGRFLKFYGADHEDWAKVAIAFLGQGTSAEHVQAMMRRYDKELGIIPLIQVHDELVFEIPKDWSDDYLRKEFFRPMVEELDVLPGFAVPVEAKRGPNWKETRSLGKISV